ncbi:hypothetical protein, partial [Puia sp.]|uniref:hypothetical protein n=1 Tax=Puia sp. TaxID=2045100 RepID=UPI002F3F5B76
TAQNAAPFDHSFFLQLPVDTTLEKDELSGLQLFRVNVKKPKTEDARHQKPPILTDTDLSRAWFVDDTPKVAGVKYLKIFVNRQLLPNTPFVVLLTFRPSHLYLDKFNQINQEIHEKSLDAAKKDYDELSSKQTVEGSNISVIWTKSYEEYESDYNRLMSDFYDDINDKDRVISQSLTTIRNSLLHDKEFNMNDLFKCNCEEDMIAKELFADSTQFLIPLQILLNVNDILPYLGNGQVNIQEFEPYKRLEMHEVKKRIENYGRLKKALVNISYFFSLSSYARKVEDATRRAIYNAVYDALAVIDKRTKALTDDYKKMRDALNTLDNLFSASLAYGDVSPQGEDLQTASGHYIIADFGLANAFTFVNNKGAYTLLPYLGVNFSFIAIDKSQPLSAIQNKRFAHHLSAVVGLTTSALTRQGTGDLTKTLSAVAGIAYRCSRAFRVTVGGLIYKRDNPNPLLPQRVTVGPMVALSLDLDLAKWFGDLKSKLY